MSLVSFKKLDNTLIPTLIIHFEYLDSWEDEYVTLLQNSPYWYFFLTLSNSISTTLPFNLDQI